MNELLTDVKKLHEETLENLRSSKANNTLRAYKSDFKDFVNTEISFNPHKMFICKSKNI